MNIYTLESIMRGCISPNWAKMHLGPGYTPKKMEKLLPLMLGWLRLPLWKKESKLWRAVPLCMLWTIWKERNRIVFEDECFSRTRLKSCFLRSISSWASLIQDVEHSFVRGILCIP